MTCGLYGKLPMKRDFVAVSAPPAFLELWEPWLQGGITASRLALGAQWQDVFLRAPIWRFWLGAELCGSAAMGSFMPSVDGVGRYFPLTAFVSDEESGSFPSPRSDPQSEWFADLEALLLGTLDEETTYDDVLARLDGLPAPARIPVQITDQPVRDLFSTSFIAVDEPASLDSAFQSVVEDRERRLQAAGCFFWTIGGEDFPPAALFSPGLPDPNILTTLLSGQF